MRQATARRSSAQHHRQRRSCFFLESDGVIAGTFALHKTGEREYELSKMAVAETMRGKGLGKRMCSLALEEACRRNASRIILYSSRSLENAIHIYRETGFVEIPLEPGIYNRANIKMELEIR
ncbi:GNAT family N-acetyltransferase [Flavobacterium selenitireducens]|uniref:GNAT family N-acetyltransferase n=1 Tax=Flavobacterium selenitireducens TaxID=2722704 RepID=UPI00168BAB50|nr:GNAT family N-acetyltransferase [Flavobacterium selenitireducens]